MIRQPLRWSRSYSKLREILGKAAVRPTAKGFEDTQLEEEGRELQTRQMPPQRFTRRISSTRPDWRIVSMCNVTLVWRQSGTKGANGIRGQEDRAMADADDVLQGSGIIGSGL